MPRPDRTGTPAARRAPGDPVPALSDITRFLSCPHCGGSLSLGAAVLRCGAGHTFDVARQGYVSLLGGRVPAEPADTAAMVAARAAFLDGGHFRPLAEGVAETAQHIVAGAVGRCVIDVGSGPGYWLASVLDRLPAHAGIAIDISKPALRRAARAHPRIGAVACDVRAPIPVRTGCAALVLSVFAPRNAPEMRRILGPGGALVVVTPTPDHLRELVGALGLLTVDPRKQERLEEALGSAFTRVAREARVFPLALARSATAAAVAMGPSAWHVDPAALRPALDRLPDPLPVTVSVEIATWHPH